MSIFKPATVTSAYLKMGLLGDPGSGKTYTSAKVMIGLVQYMRAKGIPGADKPVMFFDTETGSDWVIDLFAKAGIQLLVAKRRSFADLLVAVREAQANAAGLLIDSISHPWRELCDSYLKKKERTRLEMQDWSYLKGPYGWQQYTDLFVNSPLHIIMNGRAGDAYNNYIDDEGRRQIEKVGTKMRTEGETAYEPSLLVLMKTVEDGRSKKVKHRAIVQKDRSTLLDGAEIDNPDFESFKPHIDRLNLGGSHIGVEQFTDSGSILKTERKDWAPVQREIVIDEVTTLLTLHYPSQSAEDKKNKLKAILECFDATWTEIEKVMPLPDLRAGYDKLHRKLEGKPSRYAAEVEKPTIDDALPDHSAKPVIPGEFERLEIAKPPVQEALPLPPNPNDDLYAYMEGSGVPPLSTLRQ